MSCSRRGPLCYVCGQTINPTAMIYTFIESPSDRDVHPGKHFALFGRNRRNWRRRSRHKKQRNLLFAAELFNLQLCFLHLLHLFTFCWHTGDYVRLSDVVKLYSDFLQNSSNTATNQAQVKTSIPQNVRDLTPEQLQRFVEQQKLKQRQQQPNKATQGKQQQPGETRRALIHTTVYICNISV